ncbi:MAG: hypothetical protein NVSMB55_17030 [Mycobacteriales bacterium]
MTTVRRRTTTLLAAAVLSFALTGCGVGLNPQTYRERTTQDASNISLGNLALRNVAIAPPGAGSSELAVGSTAQVTLAIVSTSSDPDTLVSVSTPAAASASFVDGTGHVVQTVAVPANGTAGYGDFGIVLRGLTKPLRPGMYIDLTFAFQQHGTVTVKVPVKVYDTPLPRASFSSKPAAE